jgi:hypothetical protein
MTKTNLTTLIDTFGALKAQIAALKIEEDILKVALADLEPGSYEGELFRLSISDSVRESPDKVLGAEIKAVVEDYRNTLSHQYLTAHTVKTNVRTHKACARNGKSLAA